MIPRYAIAASTNNPFSSNQSKSDGLAAALSQQLLGKQIEGVWHTSVCCFGKEYWFGHGIQVGIPTHTTFGTPKEIKIMGETHVDEALFEQFLVEVHPRYNVGTYGLLEHNCNNFSDEVCEFLVGKNIPEHIVKLPNEVMDTPFGASIRPMLTMMEQRMRNTRGDTVFAEDADAISRGVSQAMGPTAQGMLTSVLEDAMAVPTPPPSSTRSGPSAPPGSASYPAEV